MNGQRIIDLSLTLAALTVASVLVLQYLDRSRQTSHRTLPPGYEVGETLPPIPGVDFSTSPRSLVMYLRSDCRFCTDSMPLYRRITADVKFERIQFIAVSVEKETVLSGYLAEFSIGVDKVASIEGIEFKSRGTPTLLLVDRAGVVVRSWGGKLESTQENELVELLSKQ